MKKTLAMLLAILMLPAGAMAQEAEIQAVQIPENTCTQIDLNGDGENETVSWLMKPGEYDSHMHFYVQNAAYNSFSFETPLIWGSSVYIADVDADGNMEIFISGDMASDDYYTYCLQYSAEGLNAVNFKDVMRGGEHVGYYDYGYGYVSAISDGVVTLTGSQDALGTYMASRQFALVDGQFETCDDGLWHFRYDVTNEDAWNYRALNPIAEIPAVFIDDENQAIESKLLVGERIMITASDTRSIAYFITEDGARGYLNIQRNTQSWGFLVGGVSENDLFEFVPYAD